MRQSDRPLSIHIHKIDTSSSGISSDEFLTDSINHQPTKYRKHNSPTCVNEPLFASSVKNNNNNNNNNNKDMWPSTPKRSLYSIMKLNILYTLTDIVRRPRNCCIGILSVILLVLFTGAVLLGIYKAPYVLLRLAELTLGEVDVMITGGNNNNNNNNNIDGPFINYNKLEPLLNDIPEIRGVAPRWIVRADARNEKSIQNNNINNNNNTISNEIKKARVTVLVIDSEIERNIGIGRSWKHRDTNYAEAHVFQSTLNYLNIRSNYGDRMSIHIPLNEIFGNIFKDDVNSPTRIYKPTRITDIPSYMLYQFFMINNIQEDYIDLIDIFAGNIILSVVDGITESKGKYPSLLGNIVIMDYKQLLPALADQSCLLGPQSLIPTNSYQFPSWTNIFGVPDIINNIKLTDMAMYLAITMNNRRNMYYKSEESRAKDMIQRSNNIMINAIGVDFNGDIQFPLMDAMDQFEIMKIILIASFSSVVVGIVILCVLLLFTLLQTNADERQFELAMMRAQGMPQVQLITLLMTQSLTFIIPGVLIGIGLLITLNTIMELGLSKFTEASPLYLVIPIVPIIISSILGICLPILASWQPVSHALHSSLRNALDIYRQVQHETKVIMIKLEALGLATWQVILGIFLVIAGFLVYYLIPYSFIFGNITLFFFLLNAVLIVMVIGLCLIMSVLEPYMESFILYLLIWGNDKKLLTIVKKNIYDHRIRNSKAFMMLLISVTTVLSSGVMFAMLSTSSMQMIKLFSGADIVIISSNFNKPINETQLTQVLESWRGIYIEDWAYCSFPLHNYPQISRGTNLQTAIYIGRRMPIVSISKSFFNTIFPEFIMESARDNRYNYKHTRDGKHYDIVRSMYETPPILPIITSNNNNNNNIIIATGIPNWAEVPNVSRKLMYTIPAIISSAARDDIGVEVGNNIILEYRYGIAGIIKPTRFRVEVRALMHRVSGFPAISSLPATLTASAVLIPESYFKLLLNPVKMDFNNEAGMEMMPGAITEIYQQKLFIRLKEGIHSNDKSTFVNSIQAYIDMISHTLMDTKESIEEINTIKDFIMYFFYFTAIVCICLCTLMMWITFVANVELNTQMLGILRALGCNKFQIARVILYEALTIVFSAFILGVLAGILVGLTVELQLTSIMVLPFEFHFPYVLIILMFILSLVAAVIGAMLPFRRISKTNINCAIKDM